MQFCILLQQYLNCSLLPKMIGRIQLSAHHQQRCGLKSHGLDLSLEFDDVMAGVCSKQTTLYDESLDHV